MAKTLLYRLFKSGRVPTDSMEQIQAEGVVLMEEGIGGSITFRNFRAPGRRHGFKKSWFSGSIVLTHQHLLAFAFSRPVIGVAWNYRKISRLKCVARDRKTLSISYDASVFNDDWSGDVEVRYSTPTAQIIARNIRKLSRRK